MMDDTDKKKTILIVDDEPANLKIISSCLESSNRKILFSRTGESALDLLTKVTPDLILIDLILPLIDGFETYAKLLKRKELEDKPVIFISVNDDPDIVSQALSMGAVDFIKKPFLPEDIKEKTSKYLN